MEKWASGQPNNGGNGGHYAFLVPKFYSGKDASLNGFKNLWHDDSLHYLENTSYPLSVICVKKDAVPILTLGYECTENEYGYLSSDYRGDESVTMSGLECQPWSSQSPHA